MLPNPPLDLIPGQRPCVIAQGKNGATNGKQTPRTAEVLCGNTRALADHVSLRALRADRCDRSESRDLSGHRPSARVAGHPYRAAVA